MKRSSQWKIVGISISFTIVIVGIYAARFMEPGFFARNLIASVITRLDRGHLPINMRGNVPGLAPFLLITKIVLNIEFLDVTQVAIGIGGRGLLYAGLLVAITKRIEIGAIGGLMAAANPWAGWGYNSIFVHSLGSVLFLTLIGLLLVRERYSDRGSINLLPVVAVIGLSILDYTALAWATVLLVTGRIIQTFRGTISPRWTYVAILSLLFMASKNTGAAIFRVAEMTDISTMEVLFGYFNAKDSAGQYAYSSAASSTLIPYSKIYYFWIIIMGIIYGISLFLYLYRENKLKLSLIDTYLISLTVAGVSVTVVYLVIGRFTQFFIFLGIPLIAILGFWHGFRRVRLLQSVTPNRSQITLAIVVILASLTLAGFANAAATEELSPYSSSATEPAAEWLFDYNNRITILTDLISQGRFRIPEAKAEVSAEYISYNQSIYTSLATGQNIPVEYLAVDYDTEAGVQSLGWQRFEGLQNHKESINRNYNLKKVYSNGDISVYQNE